MRREYVHIFRDETSDQFLSSNIIRSGSPQENKIRSGSSGSAFNEQLGLKLKNQARGKIVDQPLNQVTGGLWEPASSLAKSAMSGSAAALGAAAGGLVATGLIMGINALVNAHQERIARLEAESRERGNYQNVLIMAGRGGSYIALSTSKKNVFGYERG